ncbi:beta-2 adrenergic receptor-like [Tubulanus polymorphus]|uniref:beta-2 adrenergic receptor-like n=1 Tax=Tubulanus polymorphus TaxID=672921 RepID=UPI003DA32D63
MTTWQIWVIVAVVTILFFAIVVGNSLVIFAFVKFPRLRTVTNLVVLSLAVSDLIMGFSMPFTIFLSVFPHSKLFSTVYQCLLPFCVMAAVSFASITNMYIVTVDRYWAICYPFRYTAVMTKRRATAAISGAWCFSFSFGFAMPMLWNKGPFDEGEECTFRNAMSDECAIVVVVVAASLVVLMVAHYTRIGCIASEQMRRIAATRVNAVGEHQAAHSSRRMIKDRKAACSIAIIIGAFIILWMPMMIFLLVETAPAKDLNIPDLKFTRLLLGCVAISNSCANPIIYALRMSEFRSAFGRLVKVNCCCRRKAMLDFEQSSSSGSGEANRAPSGHCATVTEHVNPAFQPES